MPGHAFLDAELPQSINGSGVRATGMEADVLQCWGRWSALVVRKVLSLRAPNTSEGI